MPPQYSALNSYSERIFLQIQGLSMAYELTVHLYQVVSGINTPDITDVFHEALQAPMVDRLRMVGKTEMRLEAVAAPRTAGNPTPYWFFDFSRFRFEHGPGKASRTEPVEGFSLDDDEGFGEETAALYDPATGYMLVQYNHFGSRAGAIKEYFSFFNPNESRVYDFFIKMDATSEAKLAQKQILTKLHFKIAPLNMTAEQRRANVSVGRALDLNNSVGSNTVEVIVSAGQGANSMLALTPLSRLIETLKNFVQGDEDSPHPVVEKFEVTGRSAIGERAEAIDMLTPKLEQRIDGIILGSDRRYTRESRWSALRRARVGWQGLLQA